MVRLVVDHHDLPPAAEHPPDRSVRVLARPAPHGAKHGLRDEAPFLDRDVPLPDPVLPLRFERDPLPVAHQYVRAELLPVLRRHHVERLVQVVLTGQVQAIAARSAAHPVAHGQVRNEDEKVRRQRRSAHLAFVKRGPGHDQRHDHGLAGARGELQGIADEVAGFRHPAPVLDFVQVNERFHRLLLAEEEAPSDRASLLVALEPPLDEPPGHHRGATVALLAPLPDLIAQSVDELVPLRPGSGQILEQARFPADDTGDAALRIPGGGEEADGRTPPVDAPGLAAGLDLVVRVRLPVRIADDDAIDDVGHRRAPLSEIFHNGRFIAVDVHDLDRDALVAA